MRFVKFWPQTKAVMYAYFELSSPFPTLANSYFLPGCEDLTRELSVVHMVCDVHHLEPVAT